MTTTAAAGLVEQAYTALRDGDRARLVSLLDPDFEAWFTNGLPDPIGGLHRGPDDAIDRGWWAIGARYAVHAEPSRYVPCEDGSLLVLGAYHGHERRTGRSIDAAFAHYWTVGGRRLTSLHQYTDSVAWVAKAEVGS